MNYKQIGINTYKKFSEVEGNQYIAGDYALEKILKLVSVFKMKNILEIGLGIGSISDAILTFSKQNNVPVNYSGTESNDFCLKTLPNNVLHFNEIKLYNSVEFLPHNEIYEFVIVDGSDESLKQIKKHCTKNAVIFIEGGRASQVAELRAIFPNYKYAEIISMRKPPIYGPFHQPWTGGGSVIFIEPTLFQTIFVFKEKVKTFLKRRLRKFIK